MIFDRKNLTDNQLLDLYKRILKPRLIEENVNPIRQGSFKMVLRIGKRLFLLGLLQF
jgi:2-oxoisovalerate dehydrogenase E1 component